MDANRIQDEADVKILTVNNQLPRAFLQGRHHQKEYEQLWDSLHGPPRVGG